TANAQVRLNHIASTDDDPFWVVRGGAAVAGAGPCSIFHRGIAVATSAWAAPGLPQHRLGIVGFEDGVLDGSTWCMRRCRVLSTRGAVAADTAARHVNMPRWSNFRYSRSGGRQMPSLPGNCFRHHLAKRWFGIDLVVPEPPHDHEC